MLKVIPVSIEYAAQKKTTPSEIRAKAQLALQNGDLLAYMDQVRNLQIDFSGWWAKAKHALPNFHHDGHQTPAQIQPPAQYQQHPQYQPPAQYPPPAQFQPPAQYPPEEQDHSQPYADPSQSQPYTDPSQFTQELVDTIRTLEQMIVDLHNYVINNLLPKTASGAGLYPTQRNNSYPYMC